MIAELKFNEILDREQLYVLGVSGGVDSMVLLDALDRAGFRVVCAHFDHGLRSESAADAEFVRGAAEARGLPFAPAHGDVAGYRKQHGLSTEAAGRTLRYRFLFQEARKQAAAGVIAAHHADDQVETLLLHLLRGAGGRGLSGMADRQILAQFDPAIPLLRPLLNIWREEILAYAHDRAIEYVQDESNRDPAFTRNRLRHEIIPALQTLNPSFKKALLRTAETTAVDEDFLSAIAREAWQSITVETARDYVALDLEKTRALPEAIQVRLLRRASEHIGGPAFSFDRAAANRVRAHLAGGRTTGSIDLSSGLQAVCEYDRLWIVASRADLPDSAWPQLEVDSLAAGPARTRVDLGRGWYFLAGEDMHARPGYAIRIRASAAVSGLALRVRRAGDRFRPAGVAGRMKVSEAMINEKLPKRLRPRWPLIVAGDRVVWVPGCGVDRDTVPEPGDETLSLVLFRD